MKLEYDKSIARLTVDDNGIVNLNRGVKFISEVLTDTLGYIGHYVASSNLIIEEGVLEQFFDPVEDFSIIEFNGDLGKFINYYEIFKSKNHDYFIRVDREVTTTEYKENGVSYTISKDIINNKYNITNIYYKYDSNKSKQIKEDLNKHLEVFIDSFSKVSLVLRTQAGFKFKSFDIKPLDIDVDSMYNDDFKEVHEHVSKTLLNGSKGVVLLHGKAGTGKSNYIKHLTKLVPKKKFVFIPVGVIPFLSDPSFISNLIDNKGAVLVLEDCENFIKDRNKDGANNVVSTILNLSDGLLSDILGIQIICTFNTNMSNVDTALLRKGRLIAEYKFDTLSKDKTKALVSKLELEGHPDVKDEMTLSEVYNLNDNSKRTVKKQNRIGFSK